MPKKITLGILAHVDAGKTTLSEALLYLSGKLRALGRVDHKNTYLDTAPLERERGITIFSKQARFSTEACDYILLDTPGHVDFSAEAERTLTLLDYAVLVISAPDGVQNHTRTLWQLLEHYGVPTFIFVNKTDIAVKQKSDMEKALQKSLSPHCVAFYETHTKAERDERLALIHEDFLDTVLAGEPIDDGEIASLISRRKLFPVLFGAALRTEGVGHLLSVLDRYTLPPAYPESPFSATVYKIARAGHTRLTYMKITGGTLTARDELTYLTADGKSVTEKVSQIRLYSGEKSEQVDSASAGEICGVVGLTATYVGQGLGQESDAGKPILEPVLSYRIALPDGVDPRVAFPKLKELEEEEPSLHLRWNSELSQIEARLMGDIQIDLLRRLILDRFDMDCTLDTGRILYQEKIAGRTLGTGHFEPLRHYAEVQLLLEPQPAGTGLIFESRVSENDLDRNWQRLILSHLYEGDHRGTLTGARLTDTRITLVAGRAHLKHTEGGDFREATLRAVRQGLLKAGCTLLEPYYKFRLTIPSAYVGRAMTDLEMCHAVFALESATADGEGGETSTLAGRGPVATLRDYAREVISYTRGQGQLLCTSDGYEPCHNQDELVAAAAYDPEGDPTAPPHSVFCSHGAGVIVPWQEVDAHKHLEDAVDLSNPADTPPAIIPRASGIAKQYRLSDEELEAIMLREFGPIKRRRYTEPKTVAAVTSPKAHKPKPPKPARRMTILDGYNLIYAWDYLAQEAKFSLERAREALMDILSDYVAFTKTELLLVFDAYRVKDGMGSEFTRNGYRVVYTKQNQTADAYIEKVIHELGPDYSIRVVTGDYLLQISAVTAGVSRMTAKEFIAEVARVGREITEFIRKMER